MICCFEKKGKITELLDILKIQMKNFWCFLIHFGHFLTIEGSTDFLVNKFAILILESCLDIFHVKMSNLGRIISANGTRKLVSQYSRPAVSAVWAKQVK